MFFQLHIVVYSFDLTHSVSALPTQNMLSPLLSLLSLSSPLVLATLISSWDRSCLMLLRSSPCCIFIEKQSTYKKKQCLGCKLQIVYWFLFVLLNKSVWPRCPNRGLLETFHQACTCRDRHTRTCAWTAVQGQQMHTLIENIFQRNSVTLHNTS